MTTSPDSNRDRSRHLRRVGLAWIMVVCWAVVVWRLGGDEYSMQETSSMLVEWLRGMFSKLDRRTQYQLIFWVRKTAHLVEYAILALLSFRAALLSAGRSRFTTAAWVTLFVVAALATADETRQAFSATRTGSPYDVMLDVLGGSIAILGLLLVLRQVRSKGQAEDAM